MTQSFACPVYRHAKDDRQNPAIIRGDRILTYQRLEATIGSATQRLKALGVKEGDRVALATQNSVEYLIVLFALWRLGAVVCLVNPRLPPTALQRSLAGIQCSRVLDALNELCQVGVPEATFDGRYACQDLADIMWTSGSSGEPKAVVHSFGNHYYNALGANAHIPIASGDRWLLSLPLYHVSGLGIVWRTWLAAGTLVIPASVQEITQEKVTHISLVATQLHRLLEDPQGVDFLQGLKAILIGGGPISEALIHQVVAQDLPVYVTYGLTEMASQVATSLRLTRRAPLPRPHILKHAEVGISVEGEILVKGKTLFPGYAAINADGAMTVMPALDQEGWFHTGDLGCLHTAGTLSVAGRKDNMFICGGENIQPEEIERHLCCLEGIIQAVVVPVPDEEFGVRPVAFIQTRKGANSRVTRSEILSSLRGELPSFKLPVHIYPWPFDTVAQDTKPDRLLLKRLAQWPSPTLTDIS